MRCFVAVLLLCPLTLVAAERGLPLPQAEADLAADPAVSWGRLDNGLVYAVMPNAEPPDKVSIRLLVTVGSLQEEEPERGLAHYLEHMAFNGSEHYPPGALVQQLQELGAAFGAHTNAHTGFEETVYKLDLPDPQAATVDTGLTIMADWARRMSLLEAEVENERGIILAEMRDRDGPGIRTWRRLYRELYAGRRIGHRFPIGAEATVRAMDAAMMRRFYDAWYRPERMVLTVVGAIDAAAVIARIEAAFAELEGVGEEPAWTPLPLEPAAATQVLVHHEEELEDTDIRLLSVRGRLRPDDSVEERRRDLLRSVAGAVISRRLADLADAADAPIQSGAAYAYQRMDVFHGVISATARPGRVLEAIPLVEQELRRFLEYGPTAGELRIAAAEIQAQLDQAVAKAASRSNRQLAEAIYASVRDQRVLLHPEQARDLLAPMVDALDPELVRSALAEAFAGERTLIAVTGRENLGPEAEQLVTAAWAASAAEAVAAPAADEDSGWAYAEIDQEAPAPELRELDLGVQAAQLANGVHVAVLARHERPNEVLLQLRLHSGMKPLRAGLDSFAAAAFMAGGLGAHDAPALRRVLAGTTARVSGPGTDGGDVIFSASCQPQELELCLQQLRAWITDPGWRPEAFARAHAAWLEQLTAQQRDLDAQVGARWATLASAGYPQLRPATLPEARWLHLAEVRSWLQPILDEAPIELSVVGDVDAARAIALVNTWFGTLPQRPPVPITPDLEAPGALAPAAPLRNGRVWAQVPGSVARAMVILAWPTDDSGDVRRARRLGQLAQVVNELLRRRVREELGEAYSPSARHVGSDLLEGYGYLRCLVGVAPGREDAVIAVVQDLVADLVAEGIPDDVFSQVRNPTLANLPAYRHGNSYWLHSVLSQAHSQPQRLDWAQHMEADFAAITKDELEAYARRFLDPSAELILVALSLGEKNAAEAEEPALPESALPEPEPAVAP